MGDARLIAANIFALSLSAPPEGHERWTVPLLHKKALERGIAGFISVKVIYGILKKYGDLKDAAGAAESLGKDGVSPDEVRNRQLVLADKIIALSLRPPPPGRKEWDIALLQKRAVELGIVSSVTQKAVGEILRKYRALARKKIWGIDLRAKEREQLAAIAAASPSPTSCFGEYTAVQILRARILLALGEKAFTVMEIAAQCHCNPRTIRDIHKRFAEKGPARTVNHRERPPITAEAEERIRALCRDRPPAGYKRWNVKLLAKTAVERGIVADISPFYLGQLLAKGREALNSGEALVGKKGPKNRPLLRNYRLALQPGERERLLAVIRGKAPCRGSDGKISARLTGLLQARAQLLLMLADGLSSPEIVGRLRCSRAQVVLIRRRYVESGIEGILTKPQRQQELPAIWTAEQPQDQLQSIADRIIALSRSVPPAGYSSWSVKLLAKEAARRGIAEHIPQAVIKRILASQTNSGKAAKQLPQALSAARIRPVELTAAERERLLAMAGAPAGRFPVRQALRAAILLKLAEQGEAERMGKKIITASEIAAGCAEAYGYCSKALVVQVHRQFAAEGGVTGLICPPR